MVRGIDELKIQERPLNEETKSTMEECPISHS